MANGLKPLLLPQLVLQQRKQEEVHVHVQPVRQHARNRSIEEIQNMSIYSIDDASLSDLTSPVTPTFSQQYGSSSHLRSCSSASSLELIPFPCCPDTITTTSPLSPLAQQSAPLQASAPGIRPLPDVEEEDAYEREGDGGVVLAGPCDWADCICHEHHEHHAHLFQSHRRSFEYGRDILSDSEGVISPRGSVKRRRERADSTLSELTSRIGSKITVGLTRWKSNSRRPNNFAFLPASDSNLEQRPAPFQTASSRSSSVSALGRYAAATTNSSSSNKLPGEPRLSMSSAAPAASETGYFYGSSESLAPLADDEMSLDYEYDARQDIERERRHATTPLLPPLMTDRLPPSAQLQPVVQSPLQSPTIAPHPMATELASPQFYPSPPLSTTPSISSFRPSQGAVPGSFAPTSNPVSEVSSPLPPPPHHHHHHHPSFLPLELDQHDSWSDRLGHANFTVVPKPYHPETADLDTLKTLGGAWDQARINYTKHLVRTGENYGSTSKTYAMTEAKWAEIEREWRAAYDALVERIIATVGQEDASLALTECRRRFQEEGPAAIPRMLDAEGKFPDLGDEDIVGPMMREAAMNTGDEKQGGPKFWKSIAEKVRLRK